MNQNRVLRIKEVSQILGMAESTIRKKITDKNDFPAPIKLGARAIGIKSSDLEDWIKNREQSEYSTSL